jgi:hypothetical protein
MQIGSLSLFAEDLANVNGSAATKRPMGEWDDLGGTFGQEEGLCNSPV